MSRRTVFCHLQQVIGWLRLCFGCCWSYLCIRLWVCYPLLKSVERYLLIFHKLRVVYPAEMLQPCMLPPQLYQAHLSVVIKLIEVNLLNLFVWFCVLDGFHLHWVEIWVCKSVSFGGELWNLKWFLADWGPHWIPSGDLFREIVRRFTFSRLPTVKKFLLWRDVETVLPSSSLQYLFFSLYFLLLDFTCNLLKLDLLSVFENDFGRVNFLFQGALGIFF